MNIELLKQICVMIRKYPQNTDMRQFVNSKYMNGSAKLDCGTTFCIAGWAIFLSDDKTPVTEYNSRTASERLGIPLTQGTDLFYAMGANILLEDISKEWAIACIEHLIETGEVDWPSTRPEGHPLMRAL